MLVVFAFALLIIAAAVVVLFAMLAELATRVPQRSTTARDPRVRPLEAARLGHTPDVWPTTLPNPERATLLVLSTACSSCRDVAGQLAGDPGHTDWADVGVVVSSASQQNGEEFVSQFGLGTFPVHVDEGGEWLTGQFGVQTSPGALVFRAGRLMSAHVFNDVAALRSALETVQYEEAQKEAV